MNSFLSQTRFGWLPTSVRTEYFELENTLRTFSSQRSWQPAETCLRQERKQRGKAEQEIYPGCFTTGCPSVHRQNEIFNKEAKRQANDVGRIEKIEVVRDGIGNGEKIILNKYLSSPFDAACHISDWIIKSSALAMINGNKIWDMNRPLEDSCRLKFLTFMDCEPFHVNKAFWKSCSFLLGAVISTVFSDHIKVVLHSFPSPQITSGSFLYDASVGIEDWKPTHNELRVLSAEMIKLSNQALPFERLQVTEIIAKEIFSENPFKLKQIPDIASNSDGAIILYRVGSHIDISKGPLIGNTSFVGRCSITAVHQIESNEGSLYRFQGVALPKGLMLNHFAYKILEERASKLNRSTYFDRKMEQLA